MAITVVGTGNAGLWANTYSNPVITVNYQNNDILVWMQMTNGAYASPTGYTEVYNSSGSGLQLSYKVLSGTGTSITVPVTWAGQATWAVIRGNNVIVTATGNTASTSGFTITPTTGSPIGQIAFITTGNTSDLSTWTPQGFTVIYSANWPNTEYYCLVYKIFNTSLTTPAAALWSGNRSWVAFGENTSSITAPTISKGTMTSVTATSTITLVGGDTFTDTGFILSDTNPNPIYSV